MAQDQIDLTIEGEPGREVQLWYRGDRETGEAPIVFTGSIGADGRMTVAVPRAYLLLGRPVRAEGVPLDLQQEIGSSKTVRVGADATDVAGSAAKFTRAPSVPDNVSVVADFDPDGSATLMFSNLLLGLRCAMRDPSGTTSNQTAVATKVVTFHFPYTAKQPRTRMALDMMGTCNADREARVRLVVCAGDTIKAVDLSENHFGPRIIFTAESCAANPVCQVTLLLLAEHDTDEGGGAALYVDMLALSVLSDADVGVAGEAVEQGCLAGS